MKKKFKILLISNMYPSKEFKYYGIFVKNFEKYIKKYFKITRVVIKGKSKNKLEKIKKYFIFFKMILRNIKYEDFDLIYVHYISHSLIPFLFVNKIKKPLVLNVHGSDIMSKSLFNKILQKTLYRIIKKSELIIVPSNYFKNLVSNKFKIKSEKIFIYPSGGVNTKIFKPVNKKNNYIFTIGFVSRIDKGKGWDILLNAIYLLYKSNYKFRVIIIGSGSQEKLLFEKIHTLELNSVVKYLGSIPHNKLVNYFNMMDVFVFPTILPESLGLVGLEAMACGVPVIGSKIGGLQDYIINNKNGFFFEPGNAEDLKEKLIYSIENRDLLNEMGKNARFTSLKYDSNFVSKQLKIKLERIINATQKI